MRAERIKMSPPKMSPREVEVTFRGDATMWDRFKVLCYDLRDYIARSPEDLLNRFIISVVREQPLCSLEVNKVERGLHELWEEAERKVKDNHRLEKKVALRLEELGEKEIETELSYYHIDNERVKEDVCALIEQVKENLIRAGENKGEE